MTETAQQRAIRAFTEALNRRPIPPVKPVGADALSRLAAAMQNRTAEVIYDSNRHASHYLFQITTAQLETLRRIGITDAQESCLRQLNYGTVPPQNYPVNCRLNVIQAVPEHPAHWPNWWLQYRKEHIGVFRPQDHNPQEDPVSEILNGIIAVMGQAAAAALPTFADIASCVADDSGPVKLSAVYAAAANIINLAARLGRHAAAAAHYGLSLRAATAAPVYDGISVAAIKTELDAANIRYETDMGPLEHPAQLRQQKHWPGVRHFRCCPELGIWWHVDGEFNDLEISYHRPHRYAPPRSLNAADAADRQDPGNTPTFAERELMRVTTPRHPERHGKLTELAFHYGLTVLQAGDLLAGRAPSDIGLPAGPCPQAAQCHTACGYYQTTGRRNFTLYEDGGWDQCRYRQFLADYGQLPPEERETPAVSVLETLERRDRKPNLPAPEPEPDADVENAAPAPASRQSSLF